MKLEYKLENSTQYMWDMCKLKIRDFTVMPFSKKNKVKINERKAIIKIRFRMQLEKII